VGAYQCAHRLTKKRAYLDHAPDLVAVLRRADLPGDGGQLTPRDREIAQLVARGYSNKVIRRA
jgi:DNA-binding NarL/FixJ family response regulator